MPELFEREGELAACARALGRTRKGRGSAVLFEGEAGIGKSSLLAEAADRARRLGLRVLTATGRPFEESIGFGVARQLLVPALDGAGDRVFGGAAGLARPALLEEDPAGPPSTDAAFAARHGMVWLVAALAADAALVLVVDDVHWADAASVRFLGLLAERVEELPVALFVAARPGAAWTDPRLSAEFRGIVPPLRPARLSLEGVALALALVIGQTPASAFVAAAHAETDGNPYLVRALADALRREGVAPDEHHVDSIRGLGTAEIERAVAARVARLDEDARKLVQAIAVLGEGRPATGIERLAAVEPGTLARAAATLEGEGLVHGWPAPTFDHPLVRAAVLDDLGPHDASLLHARAAELAAELGELERAAAHLAEAPPAGDQDRVGLLRRVAARAMLRGAPDAAAAHLRRALAEPPPEPVRAGVLFELGLAELSLGEPTAADRLARAGAAASEPDTRLRSLMISGQALSYGGQWSEAFARMKEAIAEAGGSDPAGRELARIELAGAMLTCVPTGREARSLLDELEREVRPDSPTWPLLRGVIALHRVTRGDPREDVLAELRSGLGAPLPEHGASPVVGMPIIALILADAFAEANGAFGAILAAARQRSELTAVRILSAWQALNLMRQGRLREAEESTLAVAPEQGPPPAIAELLATVVRATAALERGDVATAATHADQPLELDPRFADVAFRDDLMVVRARIRTAEGDLESSYRLAAEAGAHQQRWGAESPPVTQWRLAAAAAAAQLGRLDEADQLLAAEIAAARRFGAPRPLAMALHAQATKARTTSKREALLREALAMLEGTTLDLQRARVNADLGELLVGMGRRTEGRTALRLALDQAWRSGADGLAERTRGALVRLGVRPRRAAVTGIRALTWAEARTARMAAAGATNREIAQELFVTEKTVETHLTAAYRKLGIPGRPELAAALEPELSERPA